MLNLATYRFSGRSSRSTDRSLFTRIIVYNYKDLGRIFTVADGECWELIRIFKRETGFFVYSNWCAQQRSKAALKIKARQASVKDTDCSFGPPDKKQHFSSVQGKKGKGKFKADDNKKKLNDAKKCGGYVCRWKMWPDLRKPNTIAQCSFSV